MFQISQGKCKAVFDRVEVTEKSSLSRVGSSEGRKRESGDCGDPSWGG